MGIFDRLSRLARSEANSFFDSVSETTQDTFGGRSRPDPVDVEAPAPESAYPLEIQEDYAALELSVGADIDAVKDAYRDMMRRYHPDRHAADPDKARLANELTVRIRQSYERLSAYLTR